MGSRRELDDQFGTMVGRPYVSALENQADSQVGFWIPYGVLQSQKGTIQWRLPVALQLIPAVLCIIAMWFLKESPRFTAKKHGEAKGKSYSLLHA